PNIEWMLACEKVLQKQFPNIPFAAVSAEDINRKEKVQGMRENQFLFLISSTILERGVTFPNIDVLVIGAEDSVFTESALVQIAGRCGRSPDFPTGEVLFYHDGKSIAMKKAVKQIKKMNKLAKSRGLIQ
ncbi:MAG TPA: helicase-related protein, partial [Atopostipes sp.]|nr:helicase-related protein [Atopostipes sp.]